MKFLSAETLMANSQLKNKSNHNVGANCNSPLFYKIRPYFIKGYLLLQIPRIFTPPHREY